MNIAYKFDKVGPDHAIRQKFRNFLITRWDYELEGSVLMRLQEMHDVPAIKVKKALDELIAINWSVDDLYRFSTDDIRELADYAESQVKIEKAIAHLRKTVKLAREAGINHMDLQGHVVDTYAEFDALEVAEQDRLDRASGRVRRM